MAIGPEDRHFRRIDLKADDLTQRILAAHQHRVGAGRRRPAELTPHKDRIKQVLVERGTTEGEHRGIARSAFGMRQHQADRDPGAPQLLAQQRGLRNAIRREVTLPRAIGEGCRWAVGIELVGWPLVALRVAQIDDISAVLQVGDQRVFCDLLADCEGGHGSAG